MREFSKIKVNPEKLAAAIEATGKKSAELSRGIGRSSNYLSNCKGKGYVATSAAIALNAVYGIPVSAYGEPEEKPEPEQMTIADAGRLWDGENGVKLVPQEAPREETPAIEANTVMIETENTVADNELREAWKETAKEAKLFEVQIEHDRLKEENGRLWKALRKARVERDEADEKRGRYEKMLRALAKDFRDVAVDAFTISAAAAEIGKNINLFLGIPAEKAKLRREIRPGDGLKLSTEEIRDILDEMERGRE